jgi:large subunit ribosomal protein L9
MQVILIEHVANLGKPGHIAKVADGYARNFLFPRKKALRATKENIAIFEARKVEIEAEYQKKKQEAETLLPKISDINLEILRQAGDDGKLYGSVGKQEIAQLITSKLGIEFDYHLIHLELKIKSVGSYQVAIHLHPEVHTNVNLTVVRSESN